ncbi:EI24 domain-containing protein [Humitalea sp. 24SJ18S-53]|uniref:EI24 domain-containing protein n=1 Tax=Humitalea sp. 24SJ18S-53 TaxID=3422307 RepID=UPI003D66437D
MPQALILALAQLGDPAFRGPLIKGVLLSALAMAALFWGSVEVAAWFAAGSAGWVGWLASGLGGFLGLFLAWWLFLPVAVGLSGLFVEQVARAVERRHYPGLPPAQGASAAAQGAWGLWFGLKMLGVQVLLLPLMFVPGVGFVVALAVSALVLGRGLFEGTAQLRMGLAAARDARAANRWAVWGLGLSLALLSLVPLAGLLVPVLGTAASVHVLWNRRTDMV